MSLVVEIRHRIGRLSLDLSLELGAGLTALMGPSGAGKTTVLNAIAGLVRPDHGLIRLDREVLVDTAARIWLPPHRRGVGYVFQDARLVPHLTVQQNLLYGRWFRRHGPGGPSPHEIVELLNLRSLLGRWPSRLSGGEKQRVALGRALLARPRLLLFDEPLASVDPHHRESILPYLDRARAEYAVPAVYVTHAWPEVVSRANRVVRLRDGKVED